MDRKCVLDWLNEVYVTPSLSYSEYTDEEIRIFAHDALVLLKEQEVVPVKEDKINKCECGETINRYWHPRFCGFCGRELLWY